MRINHRNPLPGDQNYDEDNILWEFDGHKWMRAKLEVTGCLLDDLSLIENSSVASAAANEIERLQAEVEQLRRKVKLLEGITSMPMLEAHDKITTLERLGGDLIATRNNALKFARARDAWNEYTKKKNNADT